jgi:hypothetical protein
MAGKLTHSCSIIQLSIQHDRTVEALHHPGGLVASFYGTFWDCCLGEEDAAGCQFGPVMHHPPTISTDVGMAARMVSCAVSAAVGVPVASTVAGSVGNAVGNTVATSNHYLVPGGYCRGNMEALGGEKKGKVVVGGAYSQS